MITVVPCRSGEDVGSDNLNLPGDASDPFISYLYEPSAAWHVVSQVTCLPKANAAKRPYPLPPRNNRRFSVRAVVVFQELPKSANGWVESVGYGMPVPLSFTIISLMFPE